MSTQQTHTTDADFNIFDEEEASSTDAGSNGEELTLSELNEISGRSFASKAEALKHYQHLNSLVGDQRRVETERKAKEAESKLSELEQLRQELNTLKGQSQKDKFLLANPSASDKLELVEAYASQHNLPLDEAWSKIADKFATVTQEDNSEGVRPKQRITPTQSQNIADLVTQARTGSSDAQERLIQETILKKMRG